MPSGCGSGALGLCSGTKLDKLYLPCRVSMASCRPEFLVL